MRISPHPLEVEFGLPAYGILDTIEDAFRLKVAVKGGIAESHLLNHLRNLPTIENVVHLDEDDRPDFQITYNGKILLIECKNVSPKGKMDLQKNCYPKNNPNHRFYKKDRFDILAASMQPFTGEWKFKFCPTVDLDTHPDVPERLDSRVLPQGPEWDRPLEEILPQVRTRTKEQQWTSNTLF